MPEITPTRRTVIRTAAWSVPAVTVAATAPAFAASQPAQVTYKTVTGSFVFHPTLGTAPLTNIDILVDVEAVIPDVIPAGMTANPVTTTSTVTIPGSLRFILDGSLGNPAEIGGTSVSTSKLSGALGELDSITNLTIQRAPYGTSGDIVTVASGSGAAGLTTPTTASGLVTIKLAPPVSTLVGYKADGTESGTYGSTLSPKAGQDYTLGTFTIV